ncbi:MAG: hypothetical protein MJZ29_03655 [Bacteroidaceae bacterium]|nr:hypothetical protein [Bacteroidaceae bacterium]
MKKKKFITPKVRVVKLDVEALMQGQSGGGPNKAGVNTATVIVDDHSGTDSDGNKINW